jgi:hypothetical protein
MAVKILPDVEFPRECFDYDPATGVLRWKWRPTSHFPTPDPRGPQWIAKSWNIRFSGQSTGHPTASGHLVTALLGTVFMVHRIIWKMMTGEEPPELDHCSRNPADNRWNNLRAATRQDNTRNRTMRRDSSTGLKGVTFDRRSQKFGAAICVLGRQIWLGTFVSKDDAHAAYCEAAQIRFGEFWSDGIEHFAMPQDISKS